MTNINPDNKLVTAGGLKILVEHLQDYIDDKANSSHGIHVEYATEAPKADGTAAVGTSSKVAREDHVHPLQTTVSGNAGSADKLATARTINGTSFNGESNITTAKWGTDRTITIGDTGKSVNGSANVSWSRDEIGFITDKEVTDSLTSIFGASYIPSS